MEQGHSSELGEELILTQEQGCHLSLCLNDKNSLLRA